uniref:Uncharacterized protein n=1 Tax=Oryza barthii TaxID=65489 RepID=A0A0D3GPW3_9ORYZ
MRIAVGASLSPRSPLHAAQLALGLCVIQAAPPPLTVVGLAVGIVRLKLDSLCRGELNHSNVPYSRFWSCVIRVIPTPEV